MKNVSDPTAATILLPSRMSTKAALMAFACLMPSGLLFATGHAGLLPSGYNTALARVPLGTYGETSDYQESLAKNYIDSGGLIIRSIQLSLRDHSGNVLPLGEDNWSAQLVFGYPE